MKFDEREILVILLVGLCGNNILPSLDFFINRKWKRKIELFEVESMSDVVLNILCYIKLKKIEGFRRDCN